MFKLQWFDEGENKVQDYFVFVGGARFEKVKQSEDRVYLLRMGSENLFFYWMQDPEKDGDAEKCKKLNDLLQGNSSGAAASQQNRPA